MAVNDAYKILKMLRTYTKGKKKKQPFEKINKSIRKIPYPPNFNKIPANITDPTLGASTWASGNQIWNGKTGTFTAKDKKPKHHKINSFELLISILFNKLKLK